MWLAKGDVIVSVKYRGFFPAIFLGDEMVEIGHWKNTDFHITSIQRTGGAS
jgi:hypothetical protein